MPEEFVCQSCGYVGVSEGECPDCGAKLVNLGKMDNDLTEITNNDEEDGRYDKRLVEDYDDIELDDEDEELEGVKPEKVSSKK